MDTKRKDTRTHLTLQQKAQLRAFLAVNPGLPQFAVAEWVREHFHVRLGRTTLYRIQRSPEEAFTTGNLGRKKQRRVKFPAFERRLLDFYERRRAQREDVPDDELLREAVVCREACGIGETELKLSNGWLYRFKIRHQLSNAPPQPLGVQQERPIDSMLLSVAETPLAASADDWVHALSARALTTVQAPGFFNWEPIGEMLQDNVAIVADGILLHQPGVYELSVQVKHCVPVIELPTDCVFTVHCDDRIVGRGEATADVQNDVVRSVWLNSNLVIDAQTLLKVEFLAPGYAFTDSTLELRKTID